MPLEQHSLRSLHSWTFIELYLSMATINFSKLHHWNFRPSWVPLSDFHISPDHGGLVNEVTHIRVAHSKINQEFTTISIGTTKNESHVCFYFWFFDLVSERTQYCSSGFFGHHCLHCPKLITPPLTSTETRMETTGWRVAQIPALKSGCKTPIPFCHILSLQQQPLNYFFSSCVILI